jgi:hypothetical protein
MRSERNKCTDKYMYSTSHDVYANLWSEERTIAADKAIKPVLPGQGRGKEQLKEAVECFQHMHSEREQSYGETDKRMDELGHFVRDYCFALSAIGQRIT